MLFFSSILKGLLRTAAMLRAKSVLRDMSGQRVMAVRAMLYNSYYRLLTFLFFLNHLLLIYFFFLNCTILSFFNVMLCLLSLLYIMQCLCDIISFYM